jgi:uncharacterized protein (DUF58 family)
MISILLLGALLVFGGWIWYYRRHWQDGLEAKIDFDRDALYAGEQTLITEKIENRKKMPLPVLEVAFHIRKEISFLDMENTAVSDYTYKRDVFSMLGRQRITRKLAVMCRKRGHFSIEKADFITYTPFHTHLYAGEQPVEASIYVYARRVDVSELVLLCEKMTGVRQCAKRLYEDPFAFRGIREYTLTDPMKTINWKASAKSGELMVNTFDSTLTERIMIYLNVEDGGIIRHENLIEEGISVAASLAQKLLLGGMEVGIAVNLAEEKGVLLPGQGRGQLTAIERMLSELTPKDKLVPYEQILTELPEDVTPVFISRNTAGCGEAIRNMVGKSAEGLWVVPVTAAELEADQNHQQAYGGGDHVKIRLRKVAGA